MVTFNGQYDTHIRTGEDYATLTLADVFNMKPTAKLKESGQAFIPSSYHDYDARDHAVQRDQGAFVALCGDVDSGDHPLERIEGAVRAFALGSACLIYGSAHARPGDMRWRVILPLYQPLRFGDWHDAQNAFFAFMQSQGIQMDHSLARPAQPVYLPNVPAVHATSGTPLRDGNGRPLYYRRATTGTDVPGLRIDRGAIARGIDRIRRQRADDDRMRERIRREAELRRANRSQNDSASIIADFNAANSVASTLELCGYEQSPRNPEDWRSPNQTSGTYATRIIGDKWVSLSASDAAAGLGRACKSGCFGDAYDLYVHYQHSGNHTAAFRMLRLERQQGQQARPLVERWPVPPASAIKGRAPA